MLAVTSPPGATCWLAGCTRTTAVEAVAADALNAADTGSGGSAALAAGG